MLNATSLDALMEPVSAKYACDSRNSVMARANGNDQSPRNRMAAPNPMAFECFITQDARATPNSHWTKSFRLLCRSLWGRGGKRRRMGYLDKEGRGFGKGETGAGGSGGKPRSARDDAGEGGRWEGVLQ